MKRVEQDGLSFIFYAIFRFHSEVFSQEIQSSGQSLIASSTLETGYSGISITSIMAVSSLYLKTSGANSTQP